MNITSVLPVTPVLPLDAAAGIGQITPPSTAQTFGSILNSAYQRSEQSSAESARMIDRFLTGESQDLHSVALAGQRASLEFEMLMQVRNKIVQAYQEVMRMQL